MPVRTIQKICLLLGLSFFSFLQAYTQSLNGQKIMVGADAPAFVVFNDDIVNAEFNTPEGSKFYALKGRNDKSMSITYKADGKELPDNIGLTIQEGKRSHYLIISFNKNYDINKDPSLWYDFANLKELKKIADRQKASNKEELAKLEQEQEQERQQQVKERDQEASASRKQQEADAAKRKKEIEEAGKKDIALQAENEKKLAKAREEEKKKDEERKKAEAAVKAQEEERRKIEALLKQEEESNKLALDKNKKQAEEERKKAEAAAKARDEEDKRIAAAAAKKKEEEEKARQAALIKQQEEDKKLAEAAAKRKQEEDRKLEEQLAKLKEEERKKAEAAAKKKREEEDKKEAALVQARIEAAKKQEEEERKKKAQEEAVAKAAAKKREEERLKAEEAENKRIAAEKKKADELAKAEAKRKEDERKLAEAVAKAKAEEERKKKEHEEALALLKKIEEEKEKAKKEKAYSRAGLWERYGSKGINVFDPPKMQMDYLNADCYLMADTIKNYKYAMDLVAKPANLNITSEKTVNGGVSLTLENISFNEANVYFKIKVSNKSKDDFLMGATMVYWYNEDGSPKKILKLSYLTYLQMMPIVPPGQEQHIVLVIRNASIQDNELVNINISERRPEKEKLDIVLEGKIYNKEQFKNAKPIVVETIESVKDHSTDPTEKTKKKKGKKKKD